MLTLMVLLAGGLALLLACGGAVELWDQHVTRHLDIEFHRAGVRWVPPIRRTRQARRARRTARLSLPPITSPEEYDL